MERIWLKVEGFQLCNFHRDGDGRSAWADIKIGQDSFMVNGYFFRLDKDGRILQNDAMARVRFLDVPLSHRNKRKPKMLLNDVLARAIYDFCLVGEKSYEFKDFLEGKIELKEFSFFKPEEWGEKSLRIPVDFIALRSLSARSSDGSVYASINVGAHLIFWEQLVFDRKKFCYGGSGVTRDHRDAIHDSRVIGAINQLLNRKDLRDHIRYLSETRNHDFSDAVFLKKLPGYDKKMVTERKLPRPIRFY